VINQNSFEDGESIGDFMRGHGPVKWLFLGAKKFFEFSSSQRVNVDCVVRLGFARRLLVGFGGFRKPRRLDQTLHHLLFSFKPFDSVVFEVPDALMHTF
jgi:hypothetical protein